MVLVDDNGTEGFSFIWTIQNFSYCLQQYGEFLLSPLFEVDALSKIKWCLALYPRGRLNPNKIGFFLRKVSNESFPIEVNFVLSIRQINGVFKKLEARRDIFAEAMGYGSPCSLKIDELFESGAYMENDSLTVRCRMWRSKVELSEKCYAKTIIGVERTVFVWNLTNFLAYESAKKKEIQSTSTEFPSFTIDLLWSGTSTEKKLQVEITTTKTENKNVATCELSLLDSGGKAVHFVGDRHFFKVSEGVQVWEIPFISKKILLSWKRTNLSNSALSLRCEFTASIGIKYSQVERTEIGITNDHQIRCRTPTTGLDFPGSWRDDLQRFYAEGKFSDFTVRTSNSDFAVHKAILCARSGVFRKMFEQDMKENRTGVVEIIDLDNDIVSKLLRFLYTDSVEELEWETASKLFFAADKYELLALKRKCSAFLKTHIDMSNVYDVLVLADAHQDQDLKLASEDFIGSHASEILNSEEWKRFMQDQLRLASETMHLLFLRNLKI